MNPERIPIPSSWDALWIGQPIAHADLRSGAGFRRIMR
jgi:hypothetical protein